MLIGTKGCYYISGFINNSLSFVLQVTVTVDNENVISAKKITCQHRVPPTLQQQYDLKEQTIIWKYVKQRLDVELLCH